MLCTIYQREKIPNTDKFKVNKLLEFNVETGSLYFTAPFINVMAVDIGEGATQNMVLRVVKRQMIFEQELLIFGERYAIF